LAPNPRAPTFYLLTLGCPKNEVDSDGMSTLLTRAGYRPTTNPAWADVLIVNTCGFLASAQEESIAALTDLARRKRRDQVLIAAGCLAERNGEAILHRVPAVDGLLGTRRWADITDLVAQLRRHREKHDNGRRRFTRFALLGDPETPDEQPTPRAAVQRASAYLKIADGCNAPCAFCSIPSFKGKLRSRPFAAVVAEAQALTAAGAKELVVVAQDTTDYGRDRGEPDSLPRLLHAIATRCPDLAWLRLMYAYPGHVSPALIETMATTPTILPYLDIPLQHGHPDTLRRMRRPSHLEMVFNTIERLRRAMPDICLRTTFIVGYPGETEAEFEGLLDFVRAIRFDRVGAFRFSPEPGTPAATLPDQVPEAVKQERWERLMAVQQPISLARNQAQIGRVLTVLVEGHDNGLTLARSYRDAPEIDGYVLIKGEWPAGAMFEVRITGAMAYDLIGEPVTAAPERAVSPIPLMMDDGR
jgi:ribosomal protein S12 methylthiotransferase